MLLLKKWPHRLLLLPKLKSHSGSNFSQIFDFGTRSERKTQNPAGVDSGNPDPVPLLEPASWSLCTVVSYVSMRSSSFNFPFIFLLRTLPSASFCVLICLCPLVLLLFLYWCFLYCMCFVFVYFMMLFCIGHWLAEMSGLRNFSVRVKSWSDKNWIQSNPDPQTFWKSSVRSSPDPPM